MLERHSKEMNSKHICIYMYFSLSLFLLFLLPPSPRNVIDVLRLVDLLLVLVFEGRKALPKSIPALMSKRLESFPTDKGHKQLVEAIRSGNNEDFFEAMEAGK